MTGITVSIKKALSGVALAATVAALSSACGSSAATPKAASAAPAPASGNASAAAASTGANLAQAGTILAPYTGHPSPFPVDAPLAKNLPAGSLLAYLECGTDICAAASKALGAAAAALRLQFKAVQGGSSVTSLQGAMETIIALKPAVVFVAGISLDQISSQLKQLTAEKVTVASFGIANASSYGIKAAMLSNQADAIDGRVLAAWTVQKEGAKADAVFYNTPELSFSPLVEASFLTEYKSLCPACTVRTSLLPVTTFGTTAPSQIVSDLERHPQTNVAVFPTMEAATGLASALQTAGIKVQTIGLAPTPSNLQDIKAGRLTAGIGEDVAVMVWMSVDAAIRVATGQPLTAGETLGEPPIQVLDQGAITFDPSKGYSAYPDFVSRFKKLWGVA